MSSVLFTVFWIVGSIAMYVMVKKNVAFFYASFWDADETGIFMAVVFGPYIILFIVILKTVLFILRSIRRVIDWTFKIGEYEGRGNSYRF